MSGRTGIEPREVRDNSYSLAPWEVVGLVEAPSLLHSFFTYSYPLQRAAVILSVLFHVKHSNCAWYSSCPGSVCFYHWWYKDCCGGQPCASPVASQVRVAPEEASSVTQYGNKHGQNPDPEQSPGGSGQCAMDLEEKWDTRNQKKASQRRQVMCQIKTIPANLRWCLPCARPLVGIILCPFYRWENWCIEGLENMPRSQSPCPAQSREISLFRVSATTTILPNLHTAHINIYFIFKLTNFSPK